MLPRWQLPPPFRWDLTRRNQLGSLVGPTLHPDSTILLEPLLPCAARTLAFAGDADLVFVGRSPEIVETIGIEWALKQIRGLFANGAPGYHLYIMNRAKSALTLAAGLAA